MKKFFIIALALIVAVGFAADAAFAGDLSVSGTMRVRAFDTDDWDFDGSAGADDESAYWDQRLRVAATFTAAEGISAHARLDFSEITWGSADWAGSRPTTVDNELQVDRAYLQVVQEGYKIRAGQLYASLGNTIVLDENQTGIVADITAGMPVTVTLGLLKIEEGDIASDDDDKDTVFANVAFASGAYSLNVFAALDQDEATLADEGTVFGAQVKTTVAGVALNAELDMFGGEDEATSTDYVGTQLYVNAEMKFSDQVTGGLDVVYAAGTDKLDESQLTHLNGVFGDWSIMDRGPFNADFVNYDEMDPTDDSGGAMGAGVYADFAAMENVMIQASLLYLTIDEDKATGIDSVMTYNLGLDWKFAPNTTLAFQYNGGDVDSNTAATADAEHPSTLAARLQVKF